MDKLHDWHVRAYKWNLDLQAELNSRGIWSEVKKQEHEVWRKRGERIQDELQAALTPAPPPRVELEPTTAPAQDTPAPVMQPTETISQRRARFLEWHIEAQRNEKRGALARVHERELLTNPRADRSAIGRDITKATKEKAAAGNSGAMFSQLVTNGKRQH